MIRVSYLYLFIGATIGALLLVNKATGDIQWIWVMLPAHIECMIIGFIMNLVLGTAYWIFPRYFKKPNRGHPVPAWSGFVLVNLGVLIVVFAHYLPSAEILLGAGRMTEVIGIVLFVSSLWFRVYSPPHSDG
jgi:heme/copper-type cytochrome/quinol oxidase subunit 1